MKTIITILFTFIFIVGCFDKDSESQKIYNAIENIDKQHTNFNPNYNADTTSMSLFLTFKVENGQILPKPINIELILGKDPYQPSPGTFNISYLDSLKNNLLNFTIENPLKVRTIDDTENYEETYIQKGKFSIRIPYLNEAKFLDIYDYEKKEIKKITVDIVTELNKTKIQK